MKSKLIIGLIILQGLLLVGYFSISNTFAAKTNTPKILFEKTTHDFGKVSQGSVLEYTFRFKNDGGGKLVISNVSASCGCTGAILDGKKEFEEGETSEIKVSFNTQGREGVQIKTVNVTSNDPAQSNVVLTLKCDIYKNQ